MNVYEQYIKEPSNSSVVNTKLLILTMGLDVDFNSLRRLYPNLKDGYKVNQIRVSDRHFISPQDEKRNYIPDEILINNGSEKSLSKVYFKKDSPLELSLDGKEFVIVEKNSKSKLPVEVQMVPLLKYTKYKHNDVPLDTYLTVLGLDRLTIIPFDGCEHWSHGDPCKFCGANFNRLKPSIYKPNTLELIGKFAGDYEKWWDFHKKETLEQISKSLETFLYYEKVEPHFHFMLMSGNLLDADFEWKMGLDIAKAVNSHVDLSSIDSYFNFMPPKTFSYIDKIRDTGFRNLCFNLETFHKELFQDVCPGKEKHYGYERMLEALQYGVSVFGEGNVRTNFVLGSEPVDKTLEGAEFLAQKGIVSDFSVFFPRPGSVWCKKSPPLPDEVLMFTRELVDLYKKFGFRPFCCELSSRSSIANECYKGWS